MASHNPYLIFRGVPTAEEVQRKEDEKLRSREATSLSEMARSMALLNGKVKGLDDRLRSIERYLYRSVQLQEKQLLTLNCLIPEGQRPLALGDREIHARGLLGMSVIGKLVESDIVYSFKSKAKKLHPDVNDGLTTEAYTDLNDAYNYLLELVRSDE